MIAELSAQKESERLLKLNHQRDQEAHHGERMIELIKSVADKVAKGNQEDLEGVNKTQKLAKNKRKCSNLKEKVSQLKNQQN